MRRPLVLILMIFAVLAAGAAFWFVTRSAPKPDRTAAALLPIAAPTPQVNELGALAPALIEPTDGFLSRITKKPFGIFITPETSPIPDDRFTGFHTGVDAEYSDVADEVPVRAVADGAVVASAWARGYGGVVVLEHEIRGEMVHALYGHLDPATLPKVGATVTKGSVIGYLGEGGTHEIDGVRKHLHFSIRPAGDINLRGYVATEEDLDGWIDPLTLWR